MFTAVPVSEVVLSGKHGVSKAADTAASPVATGGRKRGCAAYY